MFQRCVVGSIEYKKIFFHGLSSFVIIDDVQALCKSVETIVFYVGYRLLPDLLVLSNLSQISGLLVKFTVCEL